MAYCFATSARRCNAAAAHGSKADCEKDTNCVYVECALPSSRTVYRCWQKGLMANGAEECTMNGDACAATVLETGCAATEVLKCKDPNGATKAKSAEKEKEKEAASDVSNAGGYEAPLAALIASLALLGASF